jgi:hypothetical protein
LCQRFECGEDFGEELVVSVDSLHEFSNALAQFGVLASR